MKEARGAFSTGVEIWLRSHENDTQCYCRIPDSADDRCFFDCHDRGGSAGSLIAMPGGFGTLVEFFEIATLVQTGKIKNFPVILRQKLSLTFKKCAIEQFGPTSLFCRRVGYQDAANVPYVNRTVFECPRR